jgi:multidrug efflux pump subunit AcrA (membrane-fusion protein)
MKILQRISAPFIAIWHKFISLINRFPFATFLIFLAALIGLVVVGNQLRKPEPAAAPAEPTPLTVSTFKQDQQPMLDLTAKIEKSGVTTVLAQSPGIVRKIHVTEGKEVRSAATLVSLSTTYQGGTAQSVSRQLAERNTKYSRETFDIQKDVIGRQREIAVKGETQARELRDISRKSLDDTRAVITINEDILNGINAQISELEATNIGGINDNLILSAKQGKSMVLGTLANVRNGLRNTEYQSSDSNTPAQTAERARDLALKQLELQEKSIELAKDVSELSLKLARISEQLMYPAAPCAGVVERVYVKSGDAVNPGTPIATIRSKHTQANAVIAVPGEIARQVNQLEPTYIVLNGKEIAVFPRYISQEATEGTLHSISYTLPESVTDQVTQGSTLTMRVPLGSKQLTTKNVIAPIDAIYQTADKAYLYVIKSATQSAEAGQSGQVAELREIELGDVTGDYVQVIFGVQTSDPIITSRGVTNGQKVKTE